MTQTTEPSTELVPFRAAPQPVPDQQDGYIDAMIEAAHRAQKTGWGADGSIKGFGKGEEVRSQRLWLDPNFPIDFSQVELDRARRALISGRRQANVIKVVKLENPRAQQQSHDGTTDQDLLIVDIDGALIYLAAATTSVDTFLVDVEPYTGAYYKLLLRMANAKAQQHQMRRHQKGLLYLRAKEAHMAEDAWRKQHGEPPLPKFPSMKEAAADFGCASEPDMSLCVEMASFDEATLMLADGQKLTDDQLRELASCNPDKRLALAQQFAQHREETGKALPRPAVRAAIQLVSDRPKKTVQWEGVTRHIPTTNLWMPRTTQQELPAPVALGMLMHDVAFCLAECEGDLPKGAQGVVKRLHAILDDPAIQHLMQRVNPQDEESE